MLLEFLNCFLLGLVDPRLHSEVLSHIASHGFVVVSPYLSFGLPTSQYHAEWMIGVDAWVNKNLEDSLHNDGSSTTNVGSFI